jgi:cell division protease FtsH
VIQAPHQQHQPAPHPGFWRRNLLWIILLAVPLVVPLSIFLFWQANLPASGVEPVSYSLFITQVKAHNVISVTLTDNSVTGMFKSPVASDRQSGQSGTKFSTTIPNLSTANPVGLMQQNGVTINVQSDNSNSFWLTLLLQWCPFLLLAVIIYLFIVGCLTLYFHGRSRPPTQRTPA